MKGKIVNIFVFLVIIYFFYNSIKEHNLLLFNNKDSSDTKENIVINDKCNCDGNSNKGFLENVFSDAVTNLFEKNSDYFLRNIGIQDLKLNSVKIIKLGNFETIYRYYNVFFRNKSEGKLFICGDKIKVRYRIVKNKNPDFILTYQSNKDFTSFYEKLKDYDIIVEGEEEYIIGSSKLLELNNYVLNSTKGSEIIGNYNDFKDKQQIILSVLSGENKLEYNSDDIMIFDDSISTSYPIRCGDKVSFKYDIYSINNGKNKIYSETVKKYDYNHKNIPEIFKYLIHSKPYPGNRKIFIPYKYFKSLGLNNDLNENNYVMVDIYDVYKIPNN